MWSVLVVIAIFASTHVNGEGPGFPLIALPGDYTLMFGSTACPNKLSLNRAAKIFPAGTQCDEKSGCCIELELFKMNELNGNQLSMKIANNHTMRDRKGSKEKHFGEFTIGRFASDMNCTASNSSAAKLRLSKGTILNFFTPAQTTIINFSAEFRKPMPPATSAADGAAAAADGAAAAADSHGGGGESHGSGGDSHGSGGDSHGSGGDSHSSGGDSHGSGEHSHGSGDAHGDKLVSAEHLVTYNDPPATPATPESPANTGSTPPPPPADEGVKCGFGVNCSDNGTATPTPEKEAPNCGENHIACDNPSTQDDETKDNKTTTTNSTSRLIGLRSGDSEQLKKNVPLMSMGSECMYVQTKREKCFPANALVTLKDGSRVRMDELQTGAEVMVRPGVYSQVFMWTHRDENTYSAFVRATTSNGLQLTATHGHYVYANGELIEAAKVSVGDSISTVKGEARVVDVQIILERGLYNPQTIHGDIVVDGLVTSTYTTFAKANVAHAALAPLRSVCGVAKSAWMWLADRVVPSL